jgi:adenylyltransferase/sulfurtransferase
MKLIPKFLKDKIAKIFKATTYFGALCATQKSDFQITSKELKEKLGDVDLEIIVVLPNLKLPFIVQQTIPINIFDADKIKVDKSKTYVMVCQRGFNSYMATEKMKEKYPDLKVFNLTGGISNYK